MPVAGRIANTQPLFVLRTLRENHDVVDARRYVRAGQTLDGLVTSAVPLGLVFQQVGKVEATMSADHVKRQFAVFEHPHQERARHTENICGALGREFVVFSNDGYGLPSLHVAGDLRQQRSHGRWDHHRFATFADEFRGASLDQAAQGAKVVRVSSWFGSRRSESLQPQYRMNEISENRRRSS